MKKTIWKRILLSAAVVLLVLIAGAFAWSMFDVYPAEPEAVALAEENPAIIRQNAMFLLQPEEPGDTGLIFYPGAKVQPEAYLPLLELLRQQGLTVALVQMPFRMALFDVNAADRVMAALPQIHHWYIGGHSMGGAMASSYAAKHPERVEGAVLLAANLYGGYDPEKALLVYGSLDTIAEKILGDAVHVVAIPGGNHAQFGSYGHQPGDPEAQIPSAEQKEIAARAILEFLAGRNPD